MNKLKTILLSLILLCSFGYVKAYDAMDNDGYPLFYIRGGFNGWNAEQNYCMTRQGDHYSITLSYLDGEFKVGASEWQNNYGAVSGGQNEISSSAVVEAAPNGPNFVAHNLNDVTIEFDIRRNDSGQLQNTTIKFTIGGQPVSDGTSGTLPVLHINVYNEDGTSFNNEIIDKDLSHKNYFTGSYWLDLNGCEWMEAEGAKSIGSEEEPLPLQIKARGNYTRKAFSKKPFKLKLDKKQSLLGLSKSKHFAILAHADDNYGYMRNFTGFNLGKRIGLPWTPSQQPVEVIINGDYRGLYFLTESIRIESDRIDIQELDDLATDPELISGGYLVELDNYDEENQIRMPEQSYVGGHYLDELRITWDTPEEYSDVQKRFVTEQFSNMNDYVGQNNDKLWSYLDLDDAARYYIVEEIISHTESYHGSTYLFRDRGEGKKWHFSPLWDCGNAFNGDTHNYFYNCDPYGNTWIPSLRANEMFNDKVKETWLWFMQNRYDGLINDLNDYCSHIAEAAKADRKRWKDTPQPNYEAPQPVVDNSDIESRKYAVINHLNAKTNWLKNQFGDFNQGFFAEPERDTTPAASLPSWSSVKNVLYENIDADAEYFNLQGIRITNPAKGQIYILREGDKTSKIIF
ncbi:MAG: CotH kinase family protein [Muribaculaceae bacterium]|nr:CotH kinase family protein [Muribaculaceae bacterium]